MVIATGRDEHQLESLRALGADQMISLKLPDKALIEAFHATIYGNAVAVILDYLWGVSAERLLAAIAGGGDGAVGSRIRFVQIGAISGPEIPLAASILRSSGLEILGSGLRSVSPDRLVHTIGDVMRAVHPAKLQIRSIAHPFASVETAWNATDGLRRIVFTRK